MSHLNLIVSAQIDNATVSIDNDDVWDIMSAITYKRTSTNVVGVKIMYEESEK